MVKLEELFAAGTDSAVFSDGLAVREQLDEYLRSRGFACWSFTGSALFNGVGADLDVVALRTLDRPNHTARRLVDTDNWELCGEDYGVDSSSDFSAVRKGAVNLIIVQSEATYNSWCLAGAVCRLVGKDVGGISRQLRHAIHHVLRGCKEYSDTTPHERLRSTYAIKPKLARAPVQVTPAYPLVQADARDAAWSDLKIAFDIPDGEDETLWTCVESGAITFPNGWKLIETTGAGGVGPVAIFRTEHLPTNSETFVVTSAINYAITAAKEKK